MVLFLVTALAIYSAMHALVWYGVRPLLPAGTLAPALLAAVMVAMILAPVATRLLEHAGHEVAARALGLLGYSWMGVIFLCFAGFVLVGFWDGAATAINALARPAQPLPLHGAGTAAVVLLVVLCLGGYALIEARLLRVERVVLRSAHLPPGTPPLRLVQISDLHLGLLRRNGSLQRVLARVGPLHPDLLVVTGDLLDAQINHLEGLAEQFAALQPPLGKYAVTGNHEVYAGLGQALAFLQRAGFTVLRNDSIQPAPYLVLAGVDDPAAGAPADEGALLGTQGTTAFTILLKHRPTLSPAAAGRFDLQLSGHTHRGQIFPFNLLTGLRFPLQDGLYSLPAGGHLYTSRGTGTWGPPMRLGAPPEITLFEIRPE